MSICQRVKNEVAMFQVEKGTRSKIHSASVCEDRNLKVELEAVPVKLDSFDSSQIKLAFQTKKCCREFN